MRIRVRGPTGQVMVNIGREKTVADLKKAITDATSLDRFEVKVFDRPPRPLDLDAYEDERPLDHLELKDGEQLIISAKASTSPSQVLPQSSDSGRISTGTTSNQAIPVKQESISRSNPLSDTPEINVSSIGGTLLLRVMPDDNSCLFRAFNAVYFKGIDAMEELRSIIAQAIQADPERWTGAMLGKDPDKYCEWIQRADSWGGAIELTIFADHFDMEVCSIDVQSLRVDKFNEGRPTRCFLVYSGIHYDMIAISAEKSNPELDVTIFDSANTEIMQAATLLCSMLQEKHYYTDTSGFSIICNICYEKFVGEQGARDHIRASGHSDFSEVEK